jgi:hypothetical protein
LHRCSSNCWARFNDNSRRQDSAPQTLADGVVRRLGHGILTAHAAVAVLGEQGAGVFEAIPARSWKLWQVVDT